MKGKMTYFVVGLVLLISIYFGFPILAKYYYQNSNERFIEKVTSIKFPKNTRAIEISEMDWAVISKFTLDKEKISSFRQSCLFPSLSKNAAPALTGFMLLDSVNRPNIVDPSQYDYINDCKGKNTWCILLNKFTGELWITVEFPDMGGDAPSCNK